MHTLLVKSRPCMDEKTAKQTSQLAPMARRKIWCHAGFTAFCVAMFIAAVRYLLGISMGFEQSR